METSAEVARLKEVYGRYAASGLGQSKWSTVNRGNQAIRAERERKAHDLLARSGFLPLTQRRILDLGCGTGEQLAVFLAWGARPEYLCGVDLLPERVRIARQRFPAIDCQVANAESLPFPDAFFDLVATSTVFTSILDPRMAANVCVEINRTLIRGGAVLWYDFRLSNPWNRHVRGLSRKRVRQLFPGFETSFEAISLLPPLARRLGRLTDLLYGPLGCFPFLRTHLLGLLRKP